MREKKDRREGVERQGLGRTRQGSRWRVKDALASLDQLLKGHAASLAYQRKRGRPSGPGDEAPSHHAVSPCLLPALPKPSFLCVPFPLPQHHLPHVFPPLQSPGSQSTCPFVRSQRRVPALSGDLAFAHRKLHVHTQYHFEWARYQRKIPNRLSTGDSISRLLCVASLAVTAFVRFLLQGL